MFNSFDKATCVLWGIIIVLSIVLGILLYDRAVRNADGFFISCVV